MAVSEAEEKRLAPGSNYKEKRLNYQLEGELCFTVTSALAISASLSVRQADRLASGTGCLGIIRVEILPFSETKFS